MSTINIKLPASFTNTRKVAKQATPVLDKGIIFKAIEEHHLVVCYDEPQNEDYPPMYSIGFLKSARFTSEGVRFEVFVVGCGGMFTAEYERIKYVADCDCPKVFFKNGTRQNIGNIIGLTDNGEDSVALVRVPPFDQYSTDQCSVKEMVFTENIELGITEKKEGSEND